MDQALRFALQPLKTILLEIKELKTKSFNIPTLPQSFRHAMTMPDSAQWKAAFTAEVDGLYKTKNSFVPVKTEDVGQYPDCKKILRSSVICKRKLDKDGNVKKYKVRLVIGGNDQHLGDAALLDMQVKSITSSLTNSAILFSGIPHRPKPPNMRVIPFSIPRSAAFGPSTTLFMVIIQIQGRNVRPAYCYSAYRIYCNPVLRTARLRDAQTDQ